MSKDLTIILPAYNEERSIGLVIDEIRALPIECSILVGDNNSTDKTFYEAYNKSITARIIKERGKGNVVQKLIKEVETPYVVMVNADYTYPLKYIQLIYHLLRMEHYDVVIGCRVFKDKGSMSLLNSIGNFLLSLWASILYRKGVSDLCSGMWGFRTDKLKEFSLTSPGFTLEADFFSNAVKHKCKIVQIPIGYRARLDGSKAKLRVWDGLKIAWFLLKRRFR